jgi:hypothetical protein
MNSFEERTWRFKLAMVAACRGDTKAQQDVSQIVGQMLEDSATKPMGESLMQIIVGVRDREELTRNLEGEPATLVNQILDDLNT